MDSSDPQRHLVATRDSLSCLLGSELRALRELKFAEALQITFEKQLGEDKNNIQDSILNCTAKTVTNADDIPEAVEVSMGLGGQSTR